MRVDTKKNEECCGCTACESACPHGAIRMEADGLGFLYPRIDDSKCVDCGLCVKVCQFGKEYSREGRWDVPEVYAVRLKDEVQLSRSQSGGAFYALAVRMLERGGVVYGTGFADHFRVVHKRVETVAELEELRGSKYVQSDLRGVFPRVREDLRAGRLVLFSGTPCQVSGLQSYVGRRLQAGLYTVDLVCHGVPSPAVWADYVDYVERKTGEKCESVKFRDKTFGWASHRETFCFAHGRKLDRVTFRVLFYKHYMLRDSCHVCPYTNLKRCSDVTVGDFWGWTRISREFGDNKGVSLVLVSSERGRELFDEAKSGIYLIPSNPTDCLQPQLQYPSGRHRLREAFIRDYEARGFEYVARRYGDLGWRYRAALLKGRIVNALRRLKSKI